MSRTSKTSETSVERARQNRNASNKISFSHSLYLHDLHDRWLDRAGDEFEPTESYSYEERHIAGSYAHEHDVIDDHYE